MTRLSFVGLAHIHTPGFIGMIKKRPDVKVVSVYDADARRSVVRAKELDAKQVDSVAAALEGVDAVVVCTETNRHVEVVEKIASAGKHLFVEKPLGFSTADAAAMAGAIEKAGVIFQTGYFMRSDPKLRHVKKLIDDGTLGTITRVRYSNCHSGALGRWFDEKPNDPASDWRWMADPARAGCGAFGDLGTHGLDILIWLIGRVSRVAATLDLGTKAYEGCDETGEALLHFDNGVIGTLAAAWDDVANPVTLLVSGTKGHSALIDNVLHVKTSDRSGPVEGKDLPDAAPHAFELFLDQLAGKALPVPLVTPSEAAYRNAVMAAIYKAAQNGTWLAPGI